MPTFVAGGGASTPTGGVPLDSFGGAVILPKPGGVVAGDLLLAVLSGGGDGISYTPPAGWTQIARGDAFPVSVEVWMKVAGGSEPVGYGFTLPAHAGASGFASGSIAAWRGVDPALVVATAARPFYGTATTVFESYPVATGGQPILLVLGGAFAFTPASGAAPGAGLVGTTQRARHTVLAGVAPPPGLRHHSAITMLTDTAKPATPATATHTWNGTGGLLGLLVGVALHAVVKKGAIPISSGTTVSASLVGDPLVGRVDVAPATLVSIELEEFVGAGVRIESDPVVGVGDTTMLFGPSVSIEPSTLVRILARTDSTASPGGPFPPQLGDLPPVRPPSLFDMSARDAAEILRWAEDVEARDQDSWAQLAQALNQLGAQRATNGRMYHYDDARGMWLSEGRSLLVFTHPAPAGAYLYIGNVQGAGTGPAIGPGLIVPGRAVVTAWWATWEAGAAVGDVIVLRRNGATQRTVTPDVGTTHFRENLDGSVGFTPVDFAALDMVHVFAALTLTGLVVTLEVSWRALFPDP